MHSYIHIFVYESSVWARVRKRDDAGESFIWCKLDREWYEILLKYKLQMVQELFDSLLGLFWVCTGLCWVHLGLFWLYIGLQCFAVWCSVLQRIALCCSVLHCVAVCWSAMQCVAPWCSVMQCIEVCMHCCCSDTNEPRFMHLGLVHLFQFLSHIYKTSLS